MRSAGCGKCGVWKIRSVENAGCGKSFSIFYLCIRYCSLELKKNIVRFSHENIRIFKEFRSIVNMLRALILLTRKCQNRAIYTGENKTRLS